jgi:hypothetical protein
VRAAADNNWQITVDRETPWLGILRDARRKPQNSRLVKSSGPMYRIGAEERHARGPAAGAILAAPGI